MKKMIIATLGLAVVGFTSANAGVRFGINFGVPAPAPIIVAPAPVIVNPVPAPCVEPTPMPAPIVEAMPVCPTPGYVWVGGSWGWHENHWVWARGHWDAPVRWNHDVRWARGHDDHRGYGYRTERHDDFRRGNRGEHGEHHR